jgi:hypothetical protein
MMASFAVGSGLRVAREARKIHTEKNSKRGLCLALEVL